MLVKIETPKGKKELCLNKEIFQAIIEPPSEDSFFSMLVSGYSDIFGAGYIGYWARGVKFYEDENAWVCYEMPEETFDVEKADLLVTKFYDHTRKENNFPILGGNVKKLSFPGFEEGLSCFEIDKDLACKAFVEAFKKWGQNSIDNWDSNTVDYGVQMALYGKIMWG